jgi:hypothetical protein
MNAPNAMPLAVAITITRLTNTMVFCVPSTLRMTSMLGRLNASRASDIDVKIGGLGVHHLAGRLIAFAARAQDFDLLHV